MLNYLNKLFIKIKEERDDAVLTQANQRLLLVIKARWFLIGVLVIYGVFSALAYLYTNFKGSDPYVFEKALQLMIYPGLVVAMVASYNAFYHISWYKLPRVWTGNVKSFIFAQLAADIPVVLLLIHFTGGVNSWFWTLFLVINLELTYLLTANWQILIIGSLTGIGYSILGVLEHYKLLTSYRIPLFPDFHNATYLILMLVWVNLVSGFACLLSIYLHRSEHKELKERIIRDGLTDIYNRRYFNHRLNSELKRAQRYNRVVSLILLDIDNFKNYNDTYGHVQGDGLLKWIADIIKLNIRQSNGQDSYEIDIACRYGGEEFAIILPETGSDLKERSAIKLKSVVKEETNGAFVLAERIRQTIESAKFIKGLGVTISAGVACYPANGITDKEVIEMADKALYEAKRTGKNKTLIARNKIKATG